MSNSLQPHGPCSPWHSLGQNTGVGSLSLLQGIFPSPGIEPTSLVSCTGKRALYHSHHLGRPVQTRGGLRAHSEEQHFRRGFSRARWQLLGAAGPSLGVSSFSTADTPAASRVDEPHPVPCSGPSACRPSCALSPLTRCQSIPDLLQLASSFCCL